MSTQAMFVAAAICGISSLGVAAPVIAPAEIRLTGDWTVSVTVPGTPPVAAELKKRCDPCPDRDGLSTVVGTTAPVRCPEHVPSANLVPEAVKAIARLGLGLSHQR